MCPFLSSRICEPIYTYVWYSYLYLRCYKNVTTRRQQVCKTVLWGYFKVILAVSYNLAIWHGRKVKY